MQTLNEQDWERAQQASVLANVAQAFESDVDVSDGEDDGDALFSPVALLSPGGQADAQTLAMMLQEQLDAINKEIRYAWPGTAPGMTVSLRNRVAQERVPRMLSERSVIIKPLEFYLKHIVRLL